VRRDESESGSFFRRCCSGFCWGFTLIELLIVVAIISILAAIAVPNFLDAQVRAKVVRVNADMRTMRTGLEIYRIDNEAYPPAPYFPPPDVMTYLLTTPVAYLSGIPLDIFNVNPDPDPMGGLFGITGPFIAYLNDPWVTEVWLLMSYGPDLDFEDTEIHYDPTNGTTSDGDIYLVGSLP